MRKLHFEQHLATALCAEQDRLRGSRCNKSELLMQVAVSAAMWRQDTHGLSPTPLVSELLARAEPPASVQMALHKALIEAEAEGELAEFLPAAGYLLSDATGMFESLSSRSMRDIAAIALLADARPGAGPIKLLDLAAGSGSMLLSVAAAAGKLGYLPQVQAVELNRDTAMLAAATLFMADVTADVAVANSLTEDPFAGTTVNLALAQPPFGMSWRAESDSVEARRSAGWYPFGLPQMSDSSWLFASRLLERLTMPCAAQRAVTFMVGSALWAGGAQAAVRGAIVEQDLIESIVALPAGLTQAAVPVYAVAFASRKSGRLEGHVRLVDLRASSEGSRLREAPRQLRSGALENLKAALNSSRDGVISRIVPVERFFKAQHRARGIPSLTSPSLNAPSWMLDLPVEGAQAQALALSARYGPIHVEVERPYPARCDLDVEAILDGFSNDLKSWRKSSHWITTRMSALLIEPPIPHTTEQPTVRQQHLNLATAVLLPLSLTSPASVMGGIKSNYKAQVRILALYFSSATINPDFLVGWLNSPPGMIARERAMKAASRGAVVRAVRTDPSSLLRFCDELEVPLPPIDVQEQMATTEARLSASAAMVDSARREAWFEPEKAQEVARRFEPLFDRSISAWLTELPYPVASALWAFEAKRQDPHAAHRHIFLVWEAYTAFYAAVLLSALFQDPALREDETPRLRQALTTAGLTMSRATLGAWGVIIQRLTSRFRERLVHGTDDERTALLEVFGGSSRATLESLLDARATQLISDITHKRNSWHGHASAVNDRDLAAQTEYLVGRLEELREVVGSAWRELQCVRAGAAYRRQGQTFQNAELVVGPYAPFRHVEVAVGEMMEEGELYLCANGARQPLPLQHLVVLRSSPNDAQFTSYFYNRHEGDKVRLVAYQFAESPDVTEDFDSFAGALSGLERDIS